MFLPIKDDRVPLALSKIPYEFNDIGKRSVRDEDYLYFGNWDLFRTSIFGFRIYAPSVPEVVSTKRAI